MSGLQTRCLFLPGGRTSMRQSAAVWAAVDGIRAREGLDAAAVVRRAEAACPGENRTYAVRSYAAAYWHGLARELLGEPPLSPPERRAPGRPRAPNEHEPTTGGNAP